MPQLIVNADDFGLTAGVNRSITELHKARALTSATLMATSRHFASAAAESQVLPLAGCAPLGIGCHVVLVDGTPALPAAEIPSLVALSGKFGSADSQAGELQGGQFRRNLSSFVFDLLRGSIAEAEIELEAVAQIRLLQAAGVQVTHLDTHKHTHMFTRVLRPLLRAAALCGVPAIRNPFEPAWSVAATSHAPLTRRIEVQLLRTQQTKFTRLVKEAGVATTDGAIGVLATGSLEANGLERLMMKMPQGTWELVCHPAYCDRELDEVQTRLRASRAVEHAALMETVPRFAAAHPELELINFGQLTASR